MKKLTLLEIVQDTLNAMSSDEVSSIDETTEAIQIAELARTIYFEWTSRDDWPFQKELIQLQSLGDTTKPNYLVLQNKIAEVSEDCLEIKYEVTESGDADRTFKTIKYLKPKEFIDKTITRNTGDADVIEVEDFSGIDLFIKNDDHPTWWTSFDDDYIVFDSYKSSEDTTLQQSKTVAFALVSPTWERENTFIPEMPAKMFPSFLAEIISNAMFYYKDQFSPHDDKRSLRGMSRMRRSAGRANNDPKRNKYGRR